MQFCLNVIFGQADVKPAVQKNALKKLTFLIAFLLVKCALLNAQNWFRDMYNPAVNFFVVQQEFNDWWKIYGQEILNEQQESFKNSNEPETEGKWILYKRWEHEMLPFMVVRGGVRNGSFDSAAVNIHREKNAASVERGAEVSWSYIGPNEPFNPGGVVGCKGRLNCVRFDPVDTNIIYVGAPSGGIWKSADAGQSWTLLHTDTLAQIGVTDIAINPLNNQNIFIATGDFANDASFSIGVLESMDGGVTWNTTGLSWTPGQGMEISRLLINPLNPAMMLAATNSGIYKTTNSAVSWKRVSIAYQVSAMEFRPGDTSVVYACNTHFYKSINAGNSFSVVSSGLPPTDSVNALAIGVTPADTNCVYVLASGIAPPDLSYDPIGALYRSENGGDSFNYQSVPSQISTQGVYDLNVGVSPLNSNNVVVAAVTAGFSTDGGLTFNYPLIPSHVDNHDIRFFPNNGSRVYSANDGGLFVSQDGGNTWSGLNNGLDIGQIYVVGTSAHTPYLNISGRQDDGTLLQLDSTEASLAPGDGTNCLFDPTTDNILYGSVENGIIAKSVNSGQSYNIIVSNFTTGVNGPGNWVTPFLLNPQNHNSIYIGKDFIYKSADGGNNWTTLHSPALSSGVYWSNIAIAPSDSDYIYASTYGKLIISADGGASFKDISATGAPADIWGMAVSYTNPQKIWLATGEGVYFSNNAGQSFASMSAGLPSSDYYPYSITYLKNSPEALYLGLFNGGGVYYIDSTLSSWIPLGSGLPNASVENIEISYPAGKVRAATYGRDLWEIPIYNNWYNPPVAELQIAEGACAGEAVQFNDISSFSPTSWQWTFEGGNPSSSSEQNPSVNYAGPGVYGVIFTASNAYGSSTITSQLKIASCTGIEPNSLTASISVYPNPASNLFTAESDFFATSKTSALIYDITGRLMDVPLAYEGNKILVHVENLSNGVYVLKFQVGENSVSRLFVKAN